MNPPLRFILSAQRRNRRRRERLAAEQRLAFLLDLLQGEEDVEDGSDGPRPNAAMRYLTAYEQQFGPVDRSKPKE